MLISERFNPSRLSVLVICFTLIAGSIPFLLTAPDNVSGSLYVGPGSTYNSITSALESAAPGDTIFIESGTYNESISISKDRITLMANNTLSVIINGTGIGPAISIDADNVTLANINVTGGELNMESNGSHIFNCQFDASSGKAVNIHDSMDSLLEEMDIIYPNKDCISITSSVNITLDGANTMNTEGTSLYTVEETFIIINSSSRISVINSRVELNFTAVWIDSRNTDMLKIDECSVSSRNGSNIGIYLYNNSNFSIGKLNMGILGTGLIARNSGMGAIFKSNFSVTDDTGIDLDTVKNMNISNCNIGLWGSSTGVRIRDGTGIDILDHSTMIHGDLSVGLDIGTVDGLFISFFSSTILGDMSILVSMSGSRNVWMDNITANLIGDDCLGIEINNGYNISLTSTMLTSVGIDVDLLRVKDTAFFSMNENRLDATGNGSTAAIFEDGTIFSTFNNYISISGTGSTGTMINGAIAHLEMDRTSVQGSEVTGYSSMDSMINASHLTIEVPGMVSTAWRSIDDNTLGMEHSIIDVTGTDSSGLIMSSILDKVELRSVVVTGDDDTFMTMSTNGGVVRMVDTTINSSSFTPAVSGTGTIFHIHNSSILGAESSVFLEDSPLSTVEDSYLGSIRTFVILNSTLTIDRSEMNYTLHSLDCMNRAFVKVIDSDGIGPNLDPSSDVEVWNRIDVRTVDRFGGSLRDVDIEMKNWDRMVYSTDRFSPGSTDPKTDIYGYIEKIPLLHSHYNGSNTPTLGETAIKVYLKGTAPSDWSESFTANTSYPHTELLTSPDIDRPMVPLNLSVSPLPNDEIAFLKWNLSDDDTTHYRIYERPLGSGSARLAAEVPATTATWTSGDLGPSNRIAYWLTGWDGTWESGPSSIEVVLTNDLSSPLAPSAVFKGNVTGDSITLKWTHAGDSDLAGFSIYMNSTPSHMEFSEVLSGDPDTREVLVSDLVWGTYYSFRISAFDTSNNWSPFTETDRIRTALPGITFIIDLSYPEDGPFSGQKGANCIVEIEQNGTVEFTGRSNSSGGAVLDGLGAGEIYIIKAYPDKNFTGIFGERTGYIAVSSGPISTDPYFPVIAVDLVFDYFVRILNGTVKAKVVFEDGPRDGVVDGAKVNLLTESGTLIASKVTGGSGIASFTISNLPLRGRFQVDPPFDMQGDPINHVSGYLGTLSNFFELTEEDPDHGTMEIGIGYYDYVPPVEDLHIFTFSPTGDTIDLNIPIRITFNQPVEVSSAEDAVTVTPALKNAQYSWSSSNTTLTITHEEFVPDTKYTVTMGNQIRSEDGTGFPAGYQNNTWSFTTTKLPDTTSPGENNDRLILIIAGIAVLLVIGVLVYSRYSSKKDDDVYGSDYTEYGDDYEDDFYDSMDGMEDEYPDDIAESMMVDEDLVEDEETELLEDEEILEEDVEEPSEDVEEIDNELIDDIDEIEEGEIEVPEGSPFVESDDLEEEMIDEEEEPPPKKKKVTKKKGSGPSKKKKGKKKK